MLAGAGLVDEETGRLEHDGDALAGPVELGGILLGGREDAVAVDGEGLVVILDRALEATRGGVVLEKVGEVLLSVRSLIATTFLSCSSDMARRTMRPMRPKPLIP